MIDIFKRVKATGRELAVMNDSSRNKVLLDVADAIENEKEMLLSANAEDLSRMDRSNPLYDRLMLTGARLDDIAADMRHVQVFPPRWER